MPEPNPQPSSRMEKICANLFLISIAIYAALAFGEILTRFFLFHPSYIFQTAGMLAGHGHELKVELVADNLYQIQPNRKMGINRYGFRDYDFSPDKRGKKRICFLGDSFTMGLNVKSGETMPKMLEKYLRDWEVYNMGVVGFGPDQELNVLEKYGFKFKPDFVIDAICACNDSGDVYKDQLFTVGPQGELIATETNPVKSKVFPSFFALSNQINFLKNRDKIIKYLDPLLFGDSYDLTWAKYPDSDQSKFKFSLMKAIFTKMRDALKDKNINFLTVIIPSYENICNDQFFKDNNVSFDRYFINEQTYHYILDTEKIPMINLVPYFMQLDKTQRCALYDAGNGHLSPEGNAYVARIISLYMADQGLSEK